MSGVQEIIGDVGTSGGGGGGGTINTSNSIDVQPATQNITAQDTASSTATGANSQAIITGTPTAGSTASFSLAGWETVSVQTTGTWTGTLTAEGSFDGGTTWYQKAIKQTGTAYTANNFTANFAGAINTATLTMLRVRATAAFTGTATIKITESSNIHSVYLANNTKIADATLQNIFTTVKSASTAPIATDTALVVVESPNSALVANQTNGTQQTKITDGTTVSNNLSGDTGQNAQIVVGNRKEVSFTTTTVQAVGTTDASNYRWVSVQITSQGTSSNVTFQGSNDNSTWIAVSLNTPGSGSGITATGSAVMVHGAVYYRYFRLSVTGITAGTTAGVIEFFANPAGFNVIQAATSANGIAILADATTTTNSTVVTQVYNGTTFDRVRNATAASNTTGTGLLGTGLLAFDGTNYQQVRMSSADATSQASLLSTQSQLYNGTNFDRSRANTTGVIIAAGATTAQTSTTQITYNARRLTVIINISAFTSGTLTFTVNALTSSGYTYPMLVSTALASTGITVLRIFDGATATANAVANDSVPRSFNVVVSGTFVATYGVDFNLGV